MLPRLCSPPTPLMGLSYGEQSLCRVPPSPVHPHEGAPMLFYYNFFIFEAKSLICSLVGAFLWLSRGVASLWCQVCFRSSVVVNLHFSCPNSASVLSSCYSWYQFTWNCLQLEFTSDYHWLGGELVGDLDGFNCGVLVQRPWDGFNKWQFWLVARCTGWPCSLRDRDNPSTYTYDIREARN